MIAPDFTLSDSSDSQGFRQLVNTTPALIDYLNPGAQTGSPLHRSPPPPLSCILSVLIVDTCFYFLRNRRTFRWRMFLFRVLGQTLMRLSFWRVRGWTPRLGEICFCVEIRIVGLVRCRIFVL